MVLLEKPGEVVTREELRRRLWPANTFVSFDDGLNVAMQKLRSALTDSAEAPRNIETVPRQGYRFIAPITRSQVGGFQGPAHRLTPSASSARAMTRLYTSGETKPPTPKPLTKMACLDGTGKGHNFRCLSPLLLWLARSLSRSGGVARWGDLLR